MRALSPAVTLLLSLGLLPGCAPGPAAEAAPAPAPQAAPAPAVDPAAEERAIRELDRQWVERVGAGDIDWVVGLYTADGRLMAPNAPAAEGREAVRDGWEHLLAIPGVSLTFEPAEVDISGDGRMAYEVGRYHMSFESPDGPVTDQGKFVLVWRKVGDQWKVAVDIFNSDLPQ